VFIIFAIFIPFFIWLLRETDWLRIRLPLHTDTESEQAQAVEAPTLYKSTEFIPADMPEAKPNSFIIGGQYADIQNRS